MKKLLALLLCIALLGNIMVGCSKKADEVKPSTNTTTNTDKETDTDKDTAEEPVVETPEEVTIEIGFWPPEDRTDEIALFEGYVEKCKELYPYITVVPAHYDYDEETFLPMALAGDTPTCFLAWLTEPQKLIEGGYVADITDTMKSYGYDTLIDQGFLDIVSKDGKIYGLPKDGYGLGLGINMNLFEQAGLLDANGLPMYPKTWDELRTVAKTITEKTGKAGMYLPTSGNNGGWIFTSIAWNFGAEFIKNEDGKWVSNIDSPEVLDALQFYHDMKFVDKTLLPDALLAWNEWIQNYGTDNVGMVVCGNDVLNFPIRSFSMSKDDIAYAPMPEGPGGQFALTGGNTYMFAPDATPEQIDACFKFLEICGHSPKVTDDLKAAWENTWSQRNTDGELVGPGNLTVWNDPARDAAEQEIIDKYANINMALFQPYFDKIGDILRPEEPVLTQELYSILDQVIQSAFASEDADLAQILKDADKTFQEDYLDTLE